MPLPTYDNQAAVPEADRADFAEYKGKWQQKDLVAALLKADTALQTQADLRLEKVASDALAATEKARADAAEAASKTGKTKEELDAYAATLVKPLETENATLTTKTTDLQAKLDRIELEKLVRTHRADANLMQDRLDDPDVMEILLRSTKYENGKPVVVDAEGKPTATPFVDHLKRFSDTKKWIYAHAGTTGGGMLHSEGVTDTSPVTAEKALAQVNAQNAARPNPLAPKVVAKA